MSRYVHVELSGALRSLDLIVRALVSLGIPHRRAEVKRRIMLEGSIECAGEPVDIRFETGLFDTVEDFGLVCDANGVRLVCGELDREQLATQLLAPLQQAAVAQLVDEHAAQTGVELEQSVAEDGTRRIRLRSS